MVQLVLVCFIYLSIFDTVSARPLPLDYGQKDFDLYYDTNQPNFVKNSLTGQVKWDDHNYLDNYFFFHSNLDLDELNKFLQGEFYFASACSKDELLSNYDYLQYAHRLVVLSYLLEMNEILNYSSKKMLFGDICETDWQSLLEKCRPQTDYMTFFLKNSKYITSQIKPVVVSAEGSGKRFQQQWLEKLKIASDPSAVGIKSFCKLNKCGTLGSSEELKKSFKNACDYNKNLFLNICSEKDQLHGLSYIPEMYELIGKSNILNLIDSDVNIQGCLRIFSLYSGQIENKNEYLESIVPVLYRKLENENGYLQGRLYPAGALMEFNIKGLAQVFDEMKKIEAPEPVSKEEELKKIEDPTVVTIKTKPKNKKKNEFKPSPKLVASAKKSPAPIPKSSFLTAVEFRDRYDLERVKVDMFKFKFDYVFTLERSQMLDKSLKRFMQRATITEMKKLDGLGMKKAPVPLIFIKFMIDKGKHQGLFNLVSILGNDFYIKNTIDQNVAGVNYIRLLNDDSTDRKWQILILKK